MYKCFLTGIELRESDAYILDLYAARKAIQSLKNKIEALEKMIISLGHIDNVQTDHGVHRNRRLISRQIALALASDFNETIFISWAETLKKYKKISAEKKKRQ